MTEGIVAIRPQARARTRAGSWLQRHWWTALFWSLLLLLVFLVGLPLLGLLVGSVSVSGTPSRFAFTLAHFTKGPGRYADLRAPVHLGRLLWRQRRHGHGHRRAARVARGADDAVASLWGTPVAVRVGGSIVIALAFGVALAVPELRETD